MNYNFWGLDITMCFGKDCPIKNDCIRYVAKPEKYQSYFEESPYNDGKCTCYRDYREYDEKYEGYDSLLNWLQDYDNLLEMCDEEDKLYERLELWDSIEEIFDLNNKVNLYWKERTIREKANTEFRLGNEEKATKMIEEYLNEKENWVWGYIEMADWYDNKRDEEHYNLEKAKNILLRTEQIKDMEDMDAVYERLESIYDKLGDKEKSKEYAKKWDEYVHR